MMGPNGGRDKIMALPPLNAWSVQMLRITSFVQFNERAKEEHWWRETFGQEPETVTSKPKEGTIQQDGPFEGGVLRLVIQPGRADWLWVADISSYDPTARRIPSVGDPEGAWVTLTKTLDAWFRIAPPPTRLAVGYVLDQVTDNRDDSYRVLQAYLPTVRLSPASSRDFVYQINRPIRSRALEGYSINRLGKWMGMLVNLLAVTSGQPQTKEVTIVRLELDVNTDLDAAIPIPKEKVLPALGELAAEAMRIASKGDEGE